MGSLIALPIAAGIAFLSSKIADVETLCKWVIAYICIKIDRRHSKPRFDLYDLEAVGDPQKIGLLPPEEEIMLESPQDESHLNKASDEVLFYGVNSHSECVMFRVSRITNNEADIGLYIKLKSGRTYELETVRCRQQTSKSSSRMFTGGGLKMYDTEPMRKWRIFFKGLLKEVTENDETASRMVYVKFGLQWRANTDCFDTLSDINCSDLALAFARSKWKGFVPDLTKFHNAVNSYFQGGVIRGELYIDGTDEAIEIHVFGEKIRHLGSSTRVEGCKFSKVLGHITKNGRIVHMTELHVPSVVGSLIFGHVVSPPGKINPATNIYVKGGQLWNGEYLEMTLRTEETDFTLKATAEKKTQSYEFGMKHEYELSISNVALELNGSSGRGIRLGGYISKPHKKSVFKPITENIPKDIPLTVDFSDSICQISEITGGKGSSLGKLTQLSKKYQNFIVPDGIVVTTAAYKKFITEDIVKEIKHLADALYGNINADVREACERTMNMVIQTNLPKVVQESIAAHLEKEFGQDAYNQKMFAIRSSATGEDSEDMSAAGQMETYLGVTKLEQIMLAVKKCWASQFSYVSTQYKRQNGQILNSPMAVVIQEMVLSDVAGVLFTCDPLTGNPTIMTITANYGLGESVVSGSEEPDTIILEKNVDESLRIKEKVIGAKSHRIIIKDENGPTQEDVPEEKRKECALSDKLSLRLGKISIQIEKNYGFERDIEWGVLNDSFYIFQSRPVTTNNEETDYEIDHENDYPMRIENEYFTVCNVGEVLPGAMSPLGLDIITRFFNSSIQRWEDFSPKYCLKGLSSMYNHITLVAIDLFRQMSPENAIAKYGMIGLFGRIIDDDELFELVKERLQFQKNDIHIKLFQMLCRLFTISGLIKKTKQEYDQNRISFDNYKTSTELFDALIHACTYPCEALMCHLLVTNKSQMANMLLLYLLDKSKGQLDTDVYNDFSKILSSMSEVESADVPSAMESLAYHIGKDIRSEEFQNMCVEDAQNWLMTSTCHSGQEFRNFLNKHGHRCLKEFDMRTPTWGENSKQLVKLLQNLTKSVSKERSKQTISFQEIVSNMKIPLSNKAKIIMRLILLPLSRSGVQGREAGKSLLIRALNEWRKGYKRLAKLMASEGRIPDEDLLFFMTVLEIQELLRSRSPKIIARAVHRRRRYPLLDSYIFQEIFIGVPRPVNNDQFEIVNDDENFSMKGIPVSQGVAKGFVRVALNLDEASFLKPGEILLTYSTDIGWTPYFPALGGVATEIGGLISHGAVVSREYGLPCIAGLHGATRQFRTGDYVLLDANKGILQKLPLPE